MTDTPDVPSIWNDIAVDLAKRGHMASACAAQRRAVDMAPHRADLRSNYGNMLRRAGKRDMAVSEIVHARTLDLQFTPALFNLGVQHMEDGRPDLAVDCFDMCLAEEEVHDWRFARACALLMAGRWKEGFADYQVRLDQQQHMSLPMWDGTPLKGRTLILHAEQGLGDTLMFHRYALWLLAKERTVNYVVQQPLVRILRGSRQAGEKLPGDVHLPLMSLPHVLGIETVESPPYIGSPYVPILPEPPGTKHRIGIVWKAKASKPNMTTDEYLHGAAKSMPLEHMLELCRIPGAHLFSLQPGSTDIDDLEAHHLITDLGPRIADFADLAAFINQMDVIVSVDTAPAHLSAAMGKPTVVCCPYQHVWNWPPGERSPWYESSRTVRQKEPGIWPVSDIAAEVEKLL